MTKRVKLLDDGDEDAGGEMTIKVNQDFATRFEVSELEREWELDAVLSRM